MELIFSIGIGLAVAAIFMGGFGRGGARRPAPSDGELQAILDRLTRILVAAGCNGQVRPYEFGPGQPQTLTAGGSGARFTVDGLCAAVTFWRPGYARPSRISESDAEPLYEMEFDALLHVAGPASDRLALMGAGTRSAIRDLLRGG